MMRTAASGLALLAMLATGSASASSCGGDAATMLRRYGIFQPGRLPSLYAGGPSSAASTEPATPGGVGSVPITTDQQRKVSVLARQAASADQSGDAAGCRADLAQAKQIMR